MNLQSTLRRVWPVAAGLACFAAVTALLFGHSTPSILGFFWVLWKGAFGDGYALSETLDQRYAALAGVAPTTAPTDSTSPHVSTPMEVSLFRLMVLLLLCGGMDTPAAAAFVIPSETSVS